MVLFGAMVLFVFALFLACLEVEIEGKEGWAYNLPTWYRTKGLIPKGYGMLMGGKPLTGYHLFMFFLVLTVFHIPFVMGVELTFAAELYALSIFFAIAVLWDYLWFVLNPNYGVKKFTPEFVWWHAKSKWFKLGKFNFPFDYVVGWSISIVLNVIANIMVGYYGGIIVHLYRLWLFLVLTVVVILCAPFYHKWYHKMRKHDDRDKVDFGTDKK